MCNELVVCFEGIDPINGVIDGIDGRGQDPANITSTPAVDFCAKTPGFEMRKNHNEESQITYTKKGPEFKSLLVNGIWILSTVFHAHPVHKH